MSTKIKAGVVVVTKFCKPMTQKFQSYIEYLDREEAARTKGDIKYNLFADYMGNPNKTTGLFTKDKDSLSVQDKMQLKQLMELSQQNGSLMWQTVVSFDNRWLAENGLYDKEGAIVDEQRLKGIIRTAITKMLKNENLNQAVWSAAIHYNTDNIHIHVATVEPEPTRQKKEYTVYRQVEKNGRIVKEPVLDANGSPLKEEEYVGRFRPSSISICKSSVANQILNERDSNKMINQIMRRRILAQKKENSLFEDKKFRNDFLKLYDSMPKVNRSLWNYNSNIMQPLKCQIDAITTSYIKEYHSDDFEDLKKNLLLQQEAYQKVYGGKETDNHFAENKIADLYARMGNTILNEIKDYDRKIMIDRTMHDATEKSAASDNRRKVYQGYCLATTLRSLKRSLKNEYEKNQNEYEHELLVNKDLVLSEER